MNLIIATRNKHKLDEIRAILDAPGLAFQSALDFPGIPDVLEDGATFEANAQKKAVALAKATGWHSLADDSGLEVDALGGGPGVFSARYAGEPPDAAANNEKLLRELRGKNNRTARFRCVLALATPDGRVRFVEGRCEGKISGELRGGNGFGYDPLFVPDSFALTFAEMDAAQKNGVSHRARALAAARVAWRQVFGT